MPMSVLPATHALRLTQMGRLLSNFSFPEPRLSQFLYSYSQMPLLRMGMKFYWKNHQASGCWEIAIYTQHTWGWVVGVRVCSIMWLVMGSVTLTFSAYNIQSSDAAPGEHMVHYHLILNNYWSSKIHAVGPSISVRVSPLSLPVCTWSSDHFI
jgi:hypothetical protein